MKILSLETSGRAATVATLLAEEGRPADLLHEVNLSSTRRTARDLAPEISILLAKSGWKPCGVSLVAVSVGPGSFTGLRVGVTTAKTFAYAVGAEVIGVSTLRVVAEQAKVAFFEAHRFNIAAAIAAEREQVFSGEFAVTVDGIVELVSQIEPIDAAKWLDSLRPGQIVTGPALGKLAPRLPANVRAADSSDWQPLARTVGALAWEQYQSGHRDDLWKLVPSYYRRSAAEEKLEPEPPNTSGDADGRQADLSRVRPGKISDNEV